MLEIMVISHVFLKEIENVTCVLMVLFTFHHAFLLTGLSLKKLGVIHCFLPLKIMVMNLLKFF